MYQHRQQQQQQQPSRVSELLDSLKSEIETLTIELSSYRHQKEDYERKFNSQLAELTTIQQTIFDLDRNQLKMKQHYEEEISRLKKQLEHMNNNRDLNSPSTFRSNSPAPNPNNMIRNTPTPTIPDKGQPRRQRSGSGEFYPQQQGGTAFPSLSPLDARHVKPEKKEMDEPKDMQDERRKLQQQQAQQQQQQQAQQQQAQQQQQQQQQQQIQSQQNEMEIDERKDNNGGPDWLVGYNPNVQTNLNIDLLHNLQHNSVVCCVNFSNDGKYLATGCNRSAQIYDVDSGKKVSTFIDENDKEGDLYIRSVCFSPDGNYLATGAEDKTVKVWDIQNKKVLNTFQGHDLDIYSLDYSADGRFIVSGSGDKKAKIWDIEKGKCAFTLGNEEVGPKNGVTSVAMSPDGRLVAAGSLDNIVRLWDAQTGYFLERYEGHLDSVYSVAFSPDGKSLASGSLDRTLKLWDLSGTRSRSRCRATFNGHKDFVLSVAFSPDGNWLISGSKDRSVQFWDPKNGTTHMMLQGHKNSVISVALSPKVSPYGVFATGSGDCRARLWKYDSI
ncbi:hypothetical protein CYY_002325 [Polysphondylium violaceum]|uniref:Transcriptional repressor Tup1 N-terminal domain-containing protein n=1 Tax=Polysphondylium violaceum TaxID=133409 RepID=A0A8J4PWZ2_9MYCE|nr:hypothetical protein CYY_002325 [Polysphondylium violaceum]